MINTLNELIEALQQTRNAYGDMMVKTQVQVLSLVEVRFKVDELQYDNKPIGIKCLIIQGYVDK